MGNLGTDDWNELQMLRVRVGALELQLRSRDVILSRVAEALRFGPINSEEDRDRLLQLMLHGADVWEALKEPIRR